MDSTPDPNQRDMEDASTRCLQSAFDVSIVCVQTKTQTAHSRQDFVKGLKRRELNRWGMVMATPLDLEARLKSIVAKCPGVPSRLKRVGREIIGQLDRYSSSVDQLMQNQPVVVSAPWGCIRMVVIVS